MTSRRLRTLRNNGSRRRGSALQRRANRNHHRWDPTVSSQWEIANSRPDAQAAIAQAAAGAPSSAQSNKATEHFATATTGGSRGCAHGSARDSTCAQVKCRRPGLGRPERHPRCLRHRLSCTESPSSTRHQPVPCNPQTASKPKLVTPFAAETVEGKLPAVVTQALYGSEEREEAAIHKLATYVEERKISA